MNSRLKAWCIAAAAFPVAVLANTTANTSTDHIPGTPPAQSLNAPLNTPGAGGVLAASDSLGAEPSVPAGVPRPQAAVGDAPAAFSDSDETAAMEKQKRVWKDRAEIARYRADVASEDARARQAYEGPSSSGTAAPAPVTPPQSPTAAVASHDDFDVQFSGAVDGHWEADMVVDGQMYSSVQVGNVVGSGWKVTAITDSTVEFRKGAGHGAQTKVVRF